MTRAEIFSRLKSVIEDFFRPYNDSEPALPTFALTNDIVKTYGGDSLDVIEIVMAVEDEFGIEISDEDAERLVTVENYLDYLTPILADKETK